jgi:predicted GNAT family acetyltransferase
MSENISIVNLPEENRYEIRVGDETAGFSEYRIVREHVVFTHTVILPAFEGMGLGTRLAVFALDDVRAQGGLRIVPRCPFVSAYVRKHDDWDDLIDWPE